MIRRRLVGAVIALFSAGWLVPLWLGVDTYLTFWQVEIWPLLDGQSPGNSFPFISFARDCIVVSFCWLGAVFVFWAYFCFQALSRVGQPNNSLKRTNQSLRD